MKTILIISPQPWDFIQISKHHYARTAADAGNKVYFLEPPAQAVSGVKLVLTEHPNITLVRYSEPFYSRIRFHARPLFNVLEIILIKDIRKAVGSRFDLVWSFEPNRFHRLRQFGGRKVIYHPVDTLQWGFQLIPALEADQVYTISKTILAPFLGKATPVSLMSHGVASAFAVLAEQHGNWIRSTGNLKVGYAGNLARPIVARNVLLGLVKHYPNVEFHFWGNSEFPPEADLHTIAFLSELQTQPNSRLRGVKNTAELAADFAKMDAFILAYQPDQQDKGFDFSNSHKLLEYLATGRVVLSSPLSEYEIHENEFILFAEGNTQIAFEDQFKFLLNNLDHLNRPEIARLRRDFALENRYESHWSRIESKLDAYASGGEA
jgi:hypothetical protein